MTIAFIGIGVMGISMARNLLKGGHSLKVYTRTAEKAAPLVEEGAQLFDSVMGCVADCDAVITMVGFPKDVEEVYLSQGGVLDSAKENALVIDMTTTSPALWRHIAGLARKRGLRPLDAPVSGGDTGARDAALTVMAGGDEEDFTAALPLFQLMGRNIVYEGPDGSGQHTKMANQIAIAGAVSGVAEAIRYAEVNGLDLNRLMDTISTGSAGSWQLSTNGAKMVSGDTALGFYIKHFVKDLRIALEEAKGKGLKLPIMKKTLKTYVRMEKNGLGNLGTQALIKAYRELSSKKED